MKDRVAEFAMVISACGGRARVRLIGGESCKRCGLAALGLCKPGGTGMIYDVTNTALAVPGDRVVLGLSPAVRLKGYAAAYMLPLAGFLGAGLTACVLGSSETVSALAALLGLMATLPFSFRVLRGMDRVERMHVENIANEVPAFDDRLGTPAEADDYMRGYGPGAPASNKGQ